MQVFTDGAASRNGQDNSIGGWAFICVEKDKAIYKTAGKVLNSTNNQMEMLAVIKACEHVFAHYYNEDMDFNDEIFEIHTDSAYIHNCFKDRWWHSWILNGWQTSNKEPVKNKELWQRLIPYFENPVFNFIKVKGHDGDNTINSKWNNEVDKMAVAAKMKILE